MPQYIDQPDDIAISLSDAFPTNDAVLEQRLGRLHAKLRLGIEMDHEAQIFGQGINFFHIENWYSVHSVIRTTLKLMGLYWRGRKNAEQIQVRHNHITMKTLPSRFDDFTLLHISDLHVDINEGAMRRGKTHKSWSSLVPPSSTPGLFWP
jgi:hypothetical protein